MKNAAIAVVSPTVMSAARLLSPLLLALLLACAQPRPAPSLAKADVPAPANAPSGDPHAAYVEARARAASAAVAGDLEEAARAYVGVMPHLARHPELSDEFWSHNAMMMIRVAQGDPAAALAENDQASLAAERGTWSPEERSALAFQKDRWHRAYLTRMLAESRSGTAKEALVQYATAALADYRTSGYPDAIAILEAYFAALDGRREDALAAARRVDATKNDDIEDLYLVVVGLEAGGDHAGADAVRAIMRRPRSQSTARAIMLHWLDLDAQPSRPPTAFTPWHAKAR